MHVLDTFLISAFYEILTEEKHEEKVSFVLNSKTQNLSSFLCEINILLHEAKKRLQSCLTYPAGLYLMAM